MNSAIYLIKHIKLENRGNTQEKNSLQYGKHKGASGTAHAPHQEKIERSGGAYRSCNSVFRLENFHLELKNLQFYVCLSFFRNFASLEQ